MNTSLSHIGKDCQTTNFGGRYRHIITGSKSPKPDDILGGILADGMGLGKTLTMIASIVVSLSRLEEFAPGRLLDDEEPKMSLIPVKSTLVVVLSVCQYASFTQCVMVANEI